MKYLDPNDEGKFDLNLVLRTFEGDQKTHVFNGNKLLLEKLIYGLYYNGYSIGNAFDFLDQEKMGHISESQFIFGISKLNLDLSIFEINQLLNILKLTRFDRLRRIDFKNKFKSLIKKYNITP